MKKIKKIESCFVCEPKSPAHRRVDDLAVRLNNKEE
jgi:hypothetical protein